MSTKYLSKIIFLGTFIFIFLSSIISICQEKDALVEISTSAQKNLSMLLEKIPIGLESEYGFNKREEFSRVKLLNPINVIFPSTEYYSGESIDTANVNFFPSQHWKIPLSVDGKICCFLQGSYIENNFRILGIGGNLIAQKLNKIEEKLLIFSNMQKSILMFPEIQKQYIVYSNNKLSYMKSICISLDYFFVLESKNEQNLFETLYLCKNHYVLQKLRNHEQ